jgi:hypothetical protein
MSIILIALRDFITDPDQKVDLTSLTEEQAIALIKKSYGFLSFAVDVSIENGVAVISLPEQKEKAIEEAQRLFETGRLQWSYQSPQEVFGSLSIPQRSA